MKKKSKLIYLIINLVLLISLICTFSMTSTYKDIIRVILVLFIAGISVLQLYNLKKIDK